MADNVYLYQGDANQNYEASDNTFYMLHIDTAIMALYPDVVLDYSNGSTVAASAPQAYNDEAAALLDEPTAIPIGGLNPRSLQLQIEGFGNATMPVLTNKGTVSSTHNQGNEWGATLDGHGMFSATAFPVAFIAESHLNLSIVGYVGESRNSN